MARIFVNDYAGYPFLVQFSREFARRGHEVRHVFAGSNNTPKGVLVKQRNDPFEFSVKGLFTKKPLKKYSFVRRWFQEREYGELLENQIQEFKPDIVLSANNPLDAQKILYRSCRDHNIKFIYWLQDVIGIATYRLLKRKIYFLGDIIGNYYMHLERRLLRDSDRIVLITDDFAPLLHSWGVSDNKMTVIPNWATLEDIDPQPKSNPWSKERGLADKFCFMYTGTLGMKHNPDLLLQLALHFRINTEIQIVIVSEGPGAEWLLSKKAEHSLENISIYGFQPFEQLPNVLGSADILTAILEPDAGAYSVPSKVLTYLCARRPLLLAVPGENLAAKIVLNNRAGLVVDPQNVPLFLAAAERLRREDVLRENFAINARNYAETHFQIQAIADKFEKFLLN